MIAGPQADRKRRGKLIMIGTALRTKKANIKPLKDVAFK